jgi:cytoskeletal protein CcmA (bactofilin family)
MTHFDEMTGLLYLEGQLDASRAADVSSHAASCAECRMLLGALESEGVWLRKALALDEEPVPARLTEAPERGTAPWGWITGLGFGLAASGVYMLWNTLIEPWQAQAAQAGFTQGNFLTMLLFSSAFWKGWNNVRGSIQSLAVMTLLIIVMLLLRRHWRRFTTVAVVMGAMFFALVMPPSAAAAETKHGDPNYALPAGQEVETDLIVAADRTRIDGEVDGDLVVFSHIVTVNGHVKGDILSFAQELHLNGQVDGNVRDFSQVLMLNGTVAKNVMAWAGDIELDEKARVGGSITAGCDSVVLNGQVTGDLLAFANTIDINGLLGRDAAIRGNHLSIGPDAQIKGESKYQGHQQPQVSPSAKLGSPLQVTVLRRGAEKDYASHRFYFHQVLLWGASFVFALALLLLVPSFFLDASNSCKKVAPAMGFGVLFLFATPVAAIIACVTVVGLGLGIATILLYAIAVYAAQTFVGAWVGEALLGIGTGAGHAIGRLALGLAILRALKALPYVGGWIGLLIVIWGLGALVLAIYRRLRPQVTPALA